jgi:hypothetical protein
MSADSTPRLFVAQAELFERRAVQPAEFAEFRTRGRRGLMIALSAIGGVVLLYVLVGVALVIAPLRFEVLGLMLFLISIVALAAVVLFVRDGLATYRRYGSIGPDAELLLFRPRHGSEATQYAVVSPGNLLVRVFDDWLPMPLVVEPTEVAPASERSEQVAEWLLEQDGDFATRTLEDDERRELDRLLKHRRFKMRWYDWFYLAWAMFAMASIIAGPARSQAGTFLRAALVLYVGWITMSKILFVSRLRKEIRQAQSVGMVRLALWRPSESEEPVVVETLLPEDIPWAISGEPAPWRAH